MGTANRATPDSIERALDVHAAARRIRSWRRCSVGGTRPRAGWQVELNGADPLTLKTIREAEVFCAGLASAHLGQVARDWRPAVVAGVTPSR